MAAALSLLVDLLSPRKTRQNTHRHELPPLGRAIVPTITYDIFESLRDLNASERGHADADPGINRNDCTDSDRELDLHYIWENGRKIRLLGTLQRERAARLKPLLEARQAATALASAAEAPLIPRRPWTDQELAAVIWLNPEHRIYDHRELLGEDSIFRFQKVVWDGFEVMPIIDRTKLVIGVAGGVPQEDDGPTITAQATAALEKALSMLPGRLSRSISAGVGYDGDRPQNLPLRVHQMFALDYLSQHVAVKRLCTFATDLFAAFSPRSFGRAKTHTQAFFRSHPSLNHHFPGVWTNVTFDLGPTTVPSPQLASDKLRWCWLAITALGDFDADKGGFLILWDLGRILRFPAGTTVLLPPLLRYSISQIRAEESRYSITHYAVAAPGWVSWPTATELFSKLAELSSLRT